MKGHNEVNGKFPDEDIGLYDPTEQELYNAYANEILDKVIKDIEIMKHNNGMIKAMVAQKICKR